ncbi:beta-microseminoprotein-like [Pelodytes ibericus]
MLDTQKVLLTLAVAFSISVALSSAACSYGRLAVNPKTKSAVCMMDGEIHKVGSTWKSPSCLNCRCGKSGLRCCTTYMTPVNYDKVCEAIFNNETCSYTVVRKDDPSQSCNVTGYSG